MLAGDGGGPRTTMRQLAREIRALGVERGGILLVHASMRAIGWVEGGAPALVGALHKAVGAAGTVVVPAGTEENSDTSRAHRARIANMSPDEVRRYRNDMPPFDRRTSPSTMGALVEALRTTPGAERSDHPQSSLAAIGPEATALMADHRLNCHYGKYSPLAKLYERDAQVLMIGVGYQSCTAFHLAEYYYRAFPPSRTYTCVITTAKGERRWTSYRDVVLDASDFADIGTLFDKDGDVKRSYVGHAECRLLRVRDAVDFAKKWMKNSREVNPVPMRGL